MTITPLVVGGPLHHTLVCLDANGNYGAAEAWDRIAATGPAMLQVSGDSAAKYPLLALPAITR